MALSAFTAFGHLRFSSRPTHGEQIYRDMVRSLGNGANYSEDFDSLAMARVYANAMAFARAKYAVERAGSQFRPDIALELLPALEEEYGIVPDPGDSIEDRRRTVAAFARISRGARKNNVETVMAELLGDDFIAYLPSDETAVSSNDPESVGIYDAPGTPRSVFQAKHAIMPGTVTVEYEAVTGQRDHLLVGDRVIVEPGSHGRVEAVDVTGASETTFTATFTKPHDPGATVATGRHPQLTSARRHNVFVLSSTAIRSERLRRKADRAIRRLLRGVSTWTLTEQSEPFKVGTGKIGITTIGGVSL